MGVPIIRRRPPDPATSGQFSPRERILPPATRAATGLSTPPNDGGRRCNVAPIDGHCYHHPCHYQGPFTHCAETAQPGRNGRNGHGGGKCAGRGRIGRGSRDVRKQREWERAPCFTRPKHAPTSPAWRWRHHFTARGSVLSKQQPGKRMCVCVCVLAWTRTGVLGIPLGCFESGVHTCTHTHHTRTYACSKHALRIRLVALSRGCLSASIHTTCTPRTRTRKHTRAGAHANPPMQDTHTYIHTHTHTHTHTQTLHSCTYKTGGRGEKRELVLLDNTAKAQEGRSNKARAFPAPRGP